MKKKNFIILAIIVLLLFAFIILKGCGNDADNDINESRIDGGTVYVDQESGDNNTDECIKMQGYELCVPSDFVCTGGYQGYRYFEAACNLPGRDDFEIEIDYGLNSTAYSNSISETMIGVRSFEITNGQYGVSVCKIYESEGLNLGSEHWLCNYVENDNKIITLGIGNSFSANGQNYGRWFEADLKILKQKEGVSEEDYLEILERLVNQGVKIDWSFFEAESN